MSSAFVAMYVPEGGTLLPASITVTAVPKLVITLTCFYDVEMPFTHQNMALLIWSLQVPTQFAYQHSNIGKSIMATGQ